VAVIEDILEVYQHPYDPLRPVVCIGETNKQPIEEEHISCEPGKPEKVDFVYVRNGVAGKKTANKNYNFSFYWLFFHTYIMQSSL